ncbi:trigger factor, partial [Patescibacteria group bacterium]|nr:trigger factor [Patescibacteria group bacterium]
EMGDWAEIDFTGKMDGNVFEGGSSKNHPLIVGDGVLLPDFEQALVGMKIGEEKTFPVMFPMDYHKKEFAGKPAEFTAKLNKIKEVKLPELNDEFAQKAGDFKTIDGLKADISKFLLEDAQQKENDRQKEDAITQLIAMTKVELPKELVEQELNAMKNDFEQQLSHQQTNLEDYLKRSDITEEKLREQWRSTAEKRVLGGLALNELKKKEGIEASDDDVVKEIDRLQNLYPAEKENIEKKYDSTTERSRLKTLLAGQKAIDRLWQIATSNISSIR